jgi:alkylated DNA repair dioxygenase AlkB
VSIIIFLVSFTNVTQTSLFQNEPEIIQLNAPDGNISYQPDFLSADLADHYFALLHDTLAWQQDHILMFGKRLKLPRLQAWYGDADAAYRYSGMTMQPSPWTSALQELRGRCEDVCNVRFNAVLANLYRDGQDSMGWHADDEPELGAEPTIASLTLGEARRFELRHKINKQKLRLSLTHGSVLIMAGTTQQHWQHAIPKSPQTTGIRINLTFRAIKNLKK